jgi:hypothetical protein
MSRLARALDLAARGFHVFPVRPNSKLPVINDFPNRATRDRTQIQRWFEDGTRNIGISTTRYRDNEALLVVDVDTKGANNGEHTIITLELEGHELPATFEQSTPSGGRHLIYSVPAPVRQGVNKFGPGIDIRSRGGFIVGPDSEIDGRLYRANALQVQRAPEWMVERCGFDDGSRRDVPAPVGGVSSSRADDRARVYLADAPVAIEGQGGDHTTFKVVAALKDFGCAEERAFELLRDEWNERCSPPWELSDLRTKVRNAYRYGREPVGSRAPEAAFEKVESKDSKDEDPPHPVRALNDEYAFIKSGAFVLQETTDIHGRFDTIRLSPSDMHAWFANKTLMVNDKSVPLSKLWMADAQRREYDRVVFSPLNNLHARFYNLWRGFTVAPADTSDHPSVHAFREHMLQNVCGGKEESAHWLTSFFAHLIQRPGKKPLTALVFKGDKGTGKNALVERVGFLLGTHFLVADDERYLLSNFNSHLESNLFFVLDEASWAGDKRAEGKLKGLITGSEHVIERKGMEPYRVDNLTRVAILGNDNWLVPATVDERRFAVFNVGNARKQDRKFFEDMRVGMEQGGYACLLRYLMDYNIDGTDLNKAPATTGLTQQKHQSLEPFFEWWLDCITIDELVGGGFEGSLPASVATSRLTDAFKTWAVQRNIRSRLPGKKDIFRNLRAVAPSYSKVRKDGAPGESTYSFINPGLEILRADWERFIGGPHDWKE